MSTDITLGAGRLKSDKAAVDTATRMTLVAAGGRKDAAWLPSWRRRSYDLSLAKPETPLRSETPLSLDVDLLP